MTGHAPSYTPSPRQAGFTRWWPLAALCVIGTALFVTGLWVRAEVQMRRCEHNLRTIYSALELYEMDYGALPKLAFYPSDPLAAPNSLLVALDPYAVMTDVGVSPCAHEAIREQGLHYVWNIRMNGSNLLVGREPVWLVTELNTLAPSIKRGWFRFYHTLYSDGQIRRSRRPPDGLAELLALKPIK